MRLLTWNAANQIVLADDLAGKTPTYAILSHTWGADRDEVKIDDIRNGDAESKAGYSKIQFCGEQARKDGIEYFWIDTCCIDQRNGVELNEAINSMFKWYKDAKVCYVYLSDVSTSGNSSAQNELEAKFRKSRWFTRGWTLQELLAPNVVQFFSEERSFLGDKQALAQTVKEITEIPIAALNGEDLDQFPINERIRWTKKRHTTKPEDKAYCLLGIFKVSMLFNYGEGKNAILRLRRKINRRWGGDIAARLGDIDEAGVARQQQTTGSLNNLDAFVRQDFGSQRMSSSLQLEETRPSKRRRMSDQVEAETASNNRQIQDNYADSSQNSAIVPSTRLQTNTLTSHSMKMSKYELRDSLLFDRITFRVNNIKRPLPSTCQWLFRHPDYQKWYHTGCLEQHSGFLWIKGKPACGKSTLLKAAIDWIAKEMGRKFSQKHVVPYFFNARASASLEKSRLGLYRTLVHHLVSSYPAFLALFTERFSRKNPSIAEDDWTTQELQGFLEEVVESGEHFELYLFVDALDEAEYVDDVREMLSFLIELSERVAHPDEFCKLRICLSSRHYPQISMNRGFSLVVEDQAEHAEDIDIYIMKMLTCDDAIEKKNLRERILRKSARVFLWVKLVVPILNQLKDRGAAFSEKESFLETIPEDLNKLFVGILASNRENIETSLVLFQCLAFRLRPLEPAELFFAMQYSSAPHDTAWRLPANISVPDPTRLANKILDWSRGLVEIVNTGPDETPIVQFTHETVREFILKDNGLASIAPSLKTNIIGVSHEILRIACLRCISLNAVTQEYSRLCEATHVNNDSWTAFRTDMRQKIPFLEYAAKHLLDHTEQAQKHHVPQYTTIPDLEIAWKGNYRKWWNIFERYENRRTDSDMSLTHFIVANQCWTLLPIILNVSKSANAFCERHRSVLHMVATRGYDEAVRLLLAMGADVKMPREGKHQIMHQVMRKGHYEILRLLLDAGADPNSRDQKHGTLLQRAVLDSDEKALDVLLEYEVDVNAKGGYYGNALQAAAAVTRHVTTVRLLLDKDADVNAQGGKYGNALLAAASNLHLERVQVLLDRGADVNAKGGFYGNALQAAAARGSDTLVQLLLDRGADVNAEGGVYGHTLQAAAIRGSDTLVQLLLDRGADVNAQGGKFGNALLAATAKESGMLVRLLLDRGADVNAEGGKYGNALQAAAIIGSGTLVQLLLDRGADVNAEGGEYGNALLAATAKESGMLIRLLLDRGADVNAQGGKYGNALQAAAIRGSDTLVQLLLDRGADINAEGGQCGNALQAAAIIGSGTLVQLLLDRGADVNAQGGKYGNALQAAAIRGSDTLVQLLLDRGADVNAEGGECGNALQAAATIGSGTLVQLLLDRGADVNAKGGFYGNALQAAATIGSGTLVQLLLDRGADVNAEGGEYGNALQAAAARGFDTPVQLLLDRGADVNAEGGKYGNALQAAVWSRRIEVVELLLDRGANINAEGGHYGSAVQAAEWLKDRQIVQLLLSRGARR